MCTTGLYTVCVRLGCWSIVLYSVTLLSESIEFTGQWRVDTVDVLSTRWFVATHVCRCCCVSVCHTNDCCTLLWLRIGLLVILPGTEFRFDRCQNVSCEIIYVNCDMKWPVIFGWLCCCATEKWRLFYCVAVHSNPLSTQFSFVWSVLKRFETKVNGTTEDVSCCADPNRMKCERNEK